MNGFFTKDLKTAYEAKCEAQRLAFAPIAFQACRVLRESGLLQMVHETNSRGASLDELAAKAPIPRYGIKVLLEAGLGIGLLCVNDSRFTLTKLGIFILRDEMTRVNMEFMHHFCYRGMFDLDRAIETGKPVGLKTFGDWETFYQGMTSFPPRVLQSWLAFDHYYSEAAFAPALSLVLSEKPKTLLDVGGNTGTWAVSCAKLDPDAQITIADLPQQLELAKEAICKEKLESQVKLYPIDLLDDSAVWPSGYDVVWMSQLLDCFSKEQIVRILKRAAKSLSSAGRLYILELFWDRQPNETAAFCLQQTSLYFTCFANGNSQMYHSNEVRQCVKESGLEIVEERDGVGGYHTLLKCRSTM